MLIRFFDLQHGGTFDAGQPANLMAVVKDCHAQIPNFDIEGSAWLPGSPFS